MRVNRSLPHRRRQTIAAWCLIDHYGSNVVSDEPAHSPEADRGASDDPAARMIVGPHPHTGLQTVSWVFRGEAEHRDSVGSIAMVRPGVSALMTAGRGISHQEVAPPGAPAMRGVQLWTVLPEKVRDQAPFFELLAGQSGQIGLAEFTVFLGDFAGLSAGGYRATRLFGAEIRLPAGASVTVPVDPADEHGVLVDSGAVRLGRIESTEKVLVSPSEIGFSPVGTMGLSLSAGDAPVRALVLGGEPYREPFVMWWNLIGKNHDEIVAARLAWQRQVVQDEAAAERFSPIDSPLRPIPAPELPAVRLKPRGPVAV